MGPLRPLLVRLHRYAGLSLAGFLILAGLTGSVLAFGEELDGWLNPELFRARARGPALDPAELVARLERALPGVEVTYLPLAAPAGSTLDVRVAPREGVTLGFDQVFVEPATGQVAGTRAFGACCLDRAHLIPFLYRAHYSLQLPGTWGVVLMGGVAMLWVLDTLVGVALTLPRGGWSRRWFGAWRIEHRAGRHRLNHDIHRAGGLWLALPLLVLAVSGVAMNLPDAVFRPVVSWFSPLAPTATELAARRTQRAADTSRLDFGAAIRSAQVPARLADPGAHAIFALHDRASRTYAVAFAARAADGETGLGPSYYYVDDRSGTVFHAEPVRGGSAGDAFVRAQYWLHSGRILGVGGRIVVALCGLAVAVLGVTGILIWWRKRRAGPRRRGRPAVARGAITAAATGPSAAAGRSSRCRR